MTDNYIVYVSWIFHGTFSRNALIPHKSIAQDKQKLLALCAPKLPRRLGIRRLACLGATGHGDHARANNLFDAIGAQQILNTLKFALCSRYLNC